MDERAARAKVFSKIWWKSRGDARRSQEYMALALGVSRKTVQNWEKGLSSPTLFQGAEWFRVLGLNPMPYYTEFLFPSLALGADDDKAIDETLRFLVSQLPLQEKRQLLYLMSGKHGSSWHSLLQLFVAHCHTSLKARVAAAQVIINNYEMEEQRRELVCLEDIQPDLDNLITAIDSGKTAVKSKASGYSSVKL